MDWKALGGKLAGFGLPVLSAVIGGAIEEIPVLGSLVDGPKLVESVGRKAIAAAFGVEATPEAINAAIETRPTSEVVTTLQSVQTGMVEKWPALANMVTELGRSSVASQSIEAEDRRDVRTAATRWHETNNPLGQQQRLLSVIWVASFFVILAGMFASNILYPEIKFNEVIILLLGVVIGAVKEIMNFFFGSSAGSQSKDATIKQITESSVPPPVPVAPPAKPVVPVKR